MSLKIEHEVKILGIDLPRLLSKILEIGGKHNWSGFQQRHIFDVRHATADRSWLRLRSNEDGITLTYKEIEQGQTSEAETSVSDYSAMLVILQKLGLEPTAFQENHRRLHTLFDGVELSIDTWPGLSPFLEVEAETMEQVMYAVAMLGFSKSDISSLDIVKIYEQQGITGISHKDLKFSDEERNSLISQ